MAAQLDIENRLRGMLCGVALGDALGAPWEFEKRQPPTYEFRPIADAFPNHPEVGTTLPPPKWGPYHGHGPFFGDVGQVTDDTEMTIALIDALIAEGGWNREQALKNYILWANSEGKFIGRNTKTLLGKIKPGNVQRMIRTYQIRWECCYDMLIDAWTQSNGCLMRASPLAVLANVEDVCADCALTNAHPICLEACRFYHYWLRNVLKGAHPIEAAKSALDSLEAKPLEGVSSTVLEAAGMNLYARQLRAAAEDCINVGRELGKKDTARVAEIVRKALEGNIIDGGKGWILTSLSLAVAVFVGREHIDAVEVVRDVVRMGGDTDTNAAIAGAVAGAYTGAFASPLLDTVLACTTGQGQLVRPEQYRAVRLPHLAGQLALLWAK